MPPTSDRLLQPETIPYFAWDLKLTVAEIKRRLGEEKGALRDEVIVRLLREANSRDVWLFIDWNDIEDAWERIEPRLGRARPAWGLMWKRHREHERAAAR